MSNILYRYSSQINSIFSLPLTLFLKYPIFFYGEKLVLKRSVLYRSIVPGKYPITVEGGIIKFSIGKKHFGISKIKFMKSKDAEVDCIFDLKKGDVLFPLQPGTGNHFYFGKYSEFHIRIDFNDLEIEKISKSLF